MSWFNNDEIERRLNKLENDVNSLKYKQLRSARESQQLIDMFSQRPLIVRNYLPYEFIENLNQHLEGRYGLTPISQEEKDIKKIKEQAAKLGYDLVKRK